VPALRLDGLFPEWPVACILAPDPSPRRGADAPPRARGGIRAITGANTGVGTGVGSNVGAGADDTVILRLERDDRRTGMGTGTGTVRHVPIARSLLERILASPFRRELFLDYLRHLPRA